MLWMIKTLVNEMSALLHLEILALYVLFLISVERLGLIQLDLQGKVFSTTWSPDVPLTLAAAGSKAKLQIWDIATNSGVRKTFSGKLREAGRVFDETNIKKGGGVVGVQSDDEDSGSGDDD